MAPSPQAVEQSRGKRSHSGRLLLRMPEQLHADLADAADRASMSLNQFITTTLADAIGRGDRPARRRMREQSETTRGGADGKGGRWLPVLLAVNLVIVAAAAVLAIVLLVTSWRG